MGIYSTIPFALNKYSAYYMQRIVIGVFWKILKSPITQFFPLSLGKLKAHKKQCSWYFSDILKFSFTNFSTIYFLSNSVLQNSFQTFFFPCFTFFFKKTYVPPFILLVSAHIVSDDFHIYISTLDFFFEWQISIFYWNSLLEHFKVTSNPIYPSGNLR